MIISVNELIRRWPADMRVAAVDQQPYSAIHGAPRCLGERANSLLKTTYKILRRCRGCPWILGDILVAAALVVLHHQHGRTT